MPDSSGTGTPLGETAPVTTPKKPVSRKAVATKDPKVKDPKVWPDHMIPKDPNRTQTGLTQTSFIWDASVFDRETPDYLIPKMDQRAVSTPTYFQQLLIHDPTADVTGKIVQIETGPLSAVRKPWGDAITEPLDPFVPLDDIPLPGEPVFGALVSYEQGWFEKGLALGRLLHSTCLAPGEVTKIAVTSFHRQSRGSSDEAATQQDSLDSATDNASAVAETQNAVSHELKTGVSNNFSSVTQAQGGLAFSGLLMSGNSSVASNLAIGLTTAVATAATDFKAEGAKKVSQNTVAASHAVRARRASQVRETAEDESQTGQTRVIANYNHMHAMTMMFFEVLQCFSLETRVIDAERVVFIPMRDMHFTEESVRTYGEVLRTILAEQGLANELAMLDTFMAQDMAALHDAEQKARTALEAVLMRSGYDPATYRGLDYPDYRLLPEKVRLFELDHDSHLAELAANAQNAQAASNLATANLFLDGVRSSWPPYAAARAALKGALRIIPVLEANRLAFNQHMWMRMDASRIQRLVHQKVVESEGKRLALEKLMDPKPIGVFGNFLAFRLPHLSHDEARAFADNYVSDSSGANNVTASIVLPSGGLFGEAVLGQAIAAEKIDLTRFWNWQDSPIPILPSELSPLGMASRARDVTFSPVAMEASIVELIKQVEPSFTSPAELAKQVTAKVSEAMVAGQGALQAAQVGQVGAGATAVGNLNATLQKQAQDFTVSALNSKAVNTALGMAFPEAQSATVMGGIMGAAKPPAGSGRVGGGGGGGGVSGGMGAALGGKTGSALAGKAGAVAGDALEGVVDLKLVEALTPLP